MNVIADWRVQFHGSHFFCESHLLPVAWADTDGCVTVRRSKGGWICLSVEGVASALIEPGTRTVSIVPVRTDFPPITLEHFWADRVLPALLDFDGRLTLHAGAVHDDSASVLFLGESGRGKSTLTATFGQCGHLILSDDGVVIDAVDGVANVTPIYPSLRLLDDSLSELFPEGPEISRVSHYAVKWRVHLGERFSDGPAPLAAMFFLELPGTERHISMRPMTQAEACMGLVSGSFALDPSDARRAATRLAQASAVARAVPAWALSYPRDYARLPDVRRAILDQVSKIRPASASKVLAEPPS